MEQLSQRELLHTQGGFTIDLGIVKITIECKWKETPSGTGLKCRFILEG